MAPRPGARLDRRRPAGRSGEAARPGEAVRLAPRTWIPTSILPLTGGPALGPHSSYRPPACWRACPAPAPGGPAPDGPAPDGPAPDGPAQGGPAQGGPAQGGPAQGGPPPGADCACRDCSHHFAVLALLLRPGRSAWASRPRTGYPRRRRVSTAQSLRHTGGRQLAAVPAWTGHLSGSGLSTA
jgi:hypothetical protein